MEITAYLFNSCKQSSPMKSKVDFLNYWENKECTHKITKENIEKFLNEYNHLKPLNLSYSKKLFIGYERIFSDQMVDFIQISY